MEHTLTVAHCATVVRPDLSTRTDRPLLVHFPWTDLGLCPRAFSAISALAGLPTSTAIAKAHHLDG